MGGNVFSTPEAELMPDATGTGGPRPLLGVSVPPPGKPEEGGRSWQRFLAEELGRHADVVVPSEATGEATPPGPSGWGGADVVPEGLPDALDGCVLRGGAAERLAELRPELPVAEEGQLSDPADLEHFVERVFAHARLRALFRSGARPRDLVEFHSRHKLQLMAHDPDGYRLLGRIAATPRNADAAARYRAAFQNVLARRLTPGRHVNALQHAFGMLSGHLDDTARQGVLAAIDRYRAGDAPLAVPVLLLRHHCEVERITWASKQTYLAPFPDDLGLRTQAPQG